MAETTPTTGFSVRELFEDPNFIQMLGGIGASMDPNGAGGVLGRAAVTYSRNKAAQQLAAKQLAGGEAERKELREMNRLLLERMGPITPRGTEGVNGAKETRSGSLELDVDTGDPYKLAADLGGFTAQGQPGVNSISQSKDGSYIFDVDAPIVQTPMTVADQVDDFSPSNLYKNVTPNTRLSFTPVNQQDRLNEMADVMETSMPPSLAASMRTPTVQRVSSPAQRQAQLQGDVNDLLPRRLV